MVLNVRNRRCFPLVGLNTGLYSISVTSEVTLLPILASVQLMYADTTGTVSPRMEFCGTTYVLKILGDSEFLAD